MFEFADIGGRSGAFIGDLEEFGCFYACGDLGIANQAALELEIVSLIVDGMVPSSTPRLTWDSVRGLAKFVSFRLDFSSRWRT